MFDTTDQILSQLRAGEDSRAEFKELRYGKRGVISPRTEDLATEMVAFANAEGGTLIFGVDDSGAPAGVPRDRLDAVEQWIINVASDLCDPPIRPVLRRAVVPSVDGEVTIVLAEIPRGVHVHRTAQGRYHVRVGSTERDLDRTELARLFQDRGRGFVFDEQPVHAATANDLSRGLLGPFRALSDYPLAGPAPQHPYHLKGPARSGPPHRGRPPGAGKSHVAAGLGLRLVENGFRVLYLRTAGLVQKLQTARRDLALDSAVAKLHERRAYKNRSLLVIANEPFSAWGKVFGSDAMAVAAVDRLVYRSHIFDLNVESYRRWAAAEARRAVVWGSVRPASRRRRVRRPAMTRIGPKTGLRAAHGARPEASAPSETAGSGPGRSPACSSTPPSLPTLAPNPTPQRRDPPRCHLDCRRAGGCESRAATVAPAGDPAGGNASERRAGLVRTQRRGITGTASPELTATGLPARIEVRLGWLPRRSVERSARPAAFARFVNAPARESARHLLLSPRRCRVSGQPRRATPRSGQPSRTGSPGHQEGRAVSDTGTPQR